MASVRAGIITRTFTDTRYGFITDTEYGEDCYVGLDDIRDAPRIHPGVAVEYARVWTDRGWRAKGARAVGARYAAGGKRIKLRLRMWDVERGFGFGVSNVLRSRSVYVHVTELPPGEEPPRPGDTVEAVVVEIPRGLVAIDARVVRRAGEITEADFVERDDE